MIVMLIKGGANASQRDRYGASLSKWTTSGLFLNAVVKEAIRSIMSLSSTYGSDDPTRSPLLIKDISSIVINYLGNTMVPDKLANGGWLCEGCFLEQSRGTWHCSQPECQNKPRDQKQWPRQSREGSGLDET